MDPLDRDRVLCGGWTSLVLLLMGLLAGCASNQAIVNGDRRVVQKRRGIKKRAQLTCSDGDSCNSLGLRKLESEPAAARKLFRRACEQDFPKGCLNLAVMYRMGKGGTRNSDKVEYYLRLATYLLRKSGCVERCEARSDVDSEIAVSWSSRKLKPSASYGLSAAVIRRGIHKGLPAVRRCYKQHGHPRLRGMVKVFFRISAAGTVPSAGIQRTTIHIKPMLSCIVKVFRGLTFPKPQSAIPVVFYPLHFYSNQ